MTAARQKLDRHQVRTLVRTSLKLDWRGSINPFTGHSVKKGKIPGLAIIIILNLFISLFLGAIFLKTVDLLTGLTVAGGTAMLIVAIQILLEFGTIIISPDDYQVISPHPVNSKTFYIAKLIHLFVYVSLLSATVSIGPALFAAFRFDSIPSGLVVLFHFWVVNLFISAAMMILYTLVLKTVDRRRLERALGYLHMIAILSMYLGLNIVPKIIKRAVFDLDVQTLTWLKLFPSYWFAAWLRFFTDGWELQSFGFSLLGLVLLLALGRIAVSYLSLSYAESLVQTGWTRQARRPSRLPQWVQKWWNRSSTHEDRALLSLVRASFKHDIQFRIGVLGYLPLMLFYLVYGFTIAGSDVRDPLAPVADSQGMSNILFGIVAVIAPFMMIGVMQTSKAWQAAWVFYIAPIDRVRMVRSTGKLATLMLLPPLSILLCAIYAFLFGNLLHAAMHTTALIAIALTGLTLLNIFSINLPFSLEYAPGKMAAGTLKSMFLSIFIFGIPVGIISFVGYGGYLGWAIFIICTLVLNKLLTIGQVRRIRRVAKTWEFTG